MTGALFFTFLKIGLLSIGGGYAVIPLIREQIVGRLGWISEQMFTDIVTISQMTPGPLAVNTSTFVGLRVDGISGAAAATFGCLLCGVVISMLLYSFFRKHQNSAYIFEILNGLKSASLGLIISAAAALVLLAFFGTSTFHFNLIFSAPDWAALLIFFVMLRLLRRHKVSPVFMMLISGAAGFLFYFMIG